MRTGPSRVAASILAVFAVFAMVGCGGETAIRPVANELPTSAVVPAPSSSIGSTDPTSTAPSAPTTTAAPPTAAPPTSAPPPAPERLPALHWLSYDENGEPWLELTFAAATGPGTVGWTHLMRPFAAEGRFTGPLNGRITMELRYSDLTGMDEVVGPPTTVTADVAGDTLIFHESDGEDTTFHPG